MLSRQRDWMKSVEGASLSFNCFCCLLFYLFCFILLVCSGLEVFRFRDMIFQ